MQKMEKRKFNENENSKTNLEIFHSGIPLKKFQLALEELQQSYQPDFISCRDKEKNQIYQFIKDSIMSKGSSETLCIIFKNTTDISGSPGLGKTLCVNQIIKKVAKQQQSCIFAFVNAMRVKKSQHIFKAIMYELCGVSQTSTVSMYQLNNLFTKGHFNNIYPTKQFNPHFNKVLVIDQIDQLLTKDQEVLYTIFQWTQKKAGQLILLIISNTLDFPQTLSTKLCSRIGIKRRPFAPYKSEQIGKILSQRICQSDIFDRKAIEYMCKKIAGCSSDIRKSLQILRFAINMYITEQCANNQMKLQKIGASVLIKAHDKVYEDVFKNSFTQFPLAYKRVLQVLAQYFKVQNCSCTYRQLQDRCMFMTTGYNQIKSILLDLRDLGLINIIYATNHKDNRIGHQFHNINQLNEEQITLNIEVDRIMYAQMKDDQLNNLSK